MGKIPFAGIELTSQRVRGLRGTSELPERPVDMVVEITYDFGLWIERPIFFQRKIRFISVQCNKVHIVLL